MAFNWTEGVLRHSKHTGTDLLLMLLLADSADRDTGSCYPGRKTLARLMRSSERTVQRTIQVLVDSGELHVRQQSSPFGTNLYTIDVSLLGGDKNDSPPNCAVDHAQGETNLSGGGDKNVSLGETEMSPKPLDKQKRNTYAPDFADFWSASHGKGNKFTASQTWAKMPEEDRVAARAVIEEWGTAYERAGYSHEVQNWLKKRMWEDQPPKPFHTNGTHPVVTGRPVHPGMFEEDNQ